MCQWHPVHADGAECDVQALMCSRYKQSGKKCGVPDMRMRTAGTGSLTMVAASTALQI